MLVRWSTVCERNTRRAFTQCRLQSRPNLWRLVRRVSWGNLDCRRSAAQKRRADVVRDSRLRKANRIIEKQLGGNGVGS